MQIEVFAPAKINLALHVTGRRGDGYHLLDSLVAFAPVGDHIRIGAADETLLCVAGPEAAQVPDNGDNLVLRAAALMRETVSVHLEKVLPVASGIGGGSSDAAAVLRALAMLRGVDIPANLERLGADIPMCIVPHPARIRGIGEDVSPITLPLLPAILVNPRVHVSTPQVFKALSRYDYTPMDVFPTFVDTDHCIGWLGEQRNDLQDAAVGLSPEISTVLGELGRIAGCRLARMSGSGATCFGLFSTMEEASAGLEVLRATHPHWWLAAGALGDQTRRAAARFI